MNKNKKKYIGKINGTYNEEIRSYGYEPLEDVFKIRQTFKLIDKHGYKYEYKVRSFREGFRPPLFDRDYKYSAENVVTYLKNAKYDNIELVEYMSSMDILLKCNKDGFVWKTTVALLKKIENGECPKCIHYTDDSDWLLTLEKFHKIHGDFYDYSKVNYSGKSIFKIEIVCSEHGSFWIQASDHLVGIGCPKCGTKMTQTLRKIGIGRAKQIAYGVNKNIKILSKEYIDTHSRLDCECRVCGHLWGMSLSNLRKGRRCPICLGGDERGRGHGAFYCKTTADRNVDEWKKISANIYVLEMKNIKTDEFFYKIGIAKKERFNKRITELSREYRVDIIAIISTNMFASVYIESDLHNVFREFSYRPKIKFGGYTECFYKIDLNKIMNYAIKNNLEVEQYN